jgi:hypothetical protein
MKNLTPKSVRGLTVLAVLVTLSVMLMPAAFTQGRQDFTLVNRSGITTLPTAGLPPLVTKTEAVKSPYGAIAYSTKTREYGIGAGDTKAEAKKNALGFCGKADCETLVEYHNDWGSLAASKDGFYGAGIGATKAEAQTNAMDFCKSSSKSCALVATDCTCED